MPCGVNGSISISVSLPWTGLGRRSVGIAFRPASSSSVSSPRRSPRRTASRTTVGGVVALVVGQQQGGPLAAPPATGPAATSAVPACRPGSTSRSRSGPCLPSRSRQARATAAASARSCKRRRQARHRRPLRSADAARSRHPARLAAGSRPRPTAMSVRRGTSPSQRRSSSPSAVLAGAGRTAGARSKPARQAAVQQQAARLGRADHHVLRTGETACGEALPPGRLPLQQLVGLRPSRSASRVQAVPAKCRPAGPRVGTEGRQEGLVGLGRGRAVLQQHPVGTRRHGCQPARQLDQSPRRPGSPATTAAGSS